MIPSIARRRVTFGPTSCLRLSAWILVVCAAARLTGQAPYKSPQDDLPRSVAPQPIAFDHSLHAAQRITCLDCHPGARERERAGLPHREECMVCHAVIAAERPAIQALSALRQNSRIPWERVYRVPDFVFFSHRSHVVAGLECVTCHGPVATRSVLRQEISVNMVSCMNCHADREVSNECHLCHDLGQ